MGKTFLELKLQTKEVCRVSSRKFWWLN